jgi:riboflavin synthase
MFTGLVEGVGEVKEINREGGDVTMDIRPFFEASDIRVGDSVSVNGVCLTVTETRQGIFRADVSGETLSRTTMGRLKQGDRVNLERALKFSDRLGGHLVSGHVDGVGRITKKEQQKSSWFLRIEMDESLSKYTIEKGSIAVDGISLTINRCQDGAIEVNIIPQTGKETTILKKKVGDLVNIETDLIGKYVERFFMRGEESRPDGSTGIDKEMLMKFGFGD